jgi:hypothetical protein
VRRRTRVSRARRAPSDRLAEVAARRGVFDRIAAEYRARGSHIVSVARQFLWGSWDKSRSLSSCNTSPTKRGWLVVTSLGSTQAGLELGKRILQRPWRVRGMAYMPTDRQGNNAIARLINEAAKLLGVAVSVVPADLANRGEWSGPEYATPSVQSQETMRGNRSVDPGPALQRKGQGWTHRRRSYWLFSSR